MKTLKLFAMILLIGAIAVSCEKEGPTGPQGPAGTNGTNGNANVIVNAYGSTVFDAGNGYWNSFTPAGLTDANVNSSVVLCYYKNFSWYTVGGMGPGGMGYQTRQFLNPSPAELNIRLNNLDGTAYSGADVTWDSLKVYIVPANVFASAKINKLDFDNYQKVNNYFSEK